ncbi:T-complex protein 1 subunit beta [Tanacetum coccineum]
MMSYDLVHLRKIYQRRNAPKNLELPVQPEGWKSMGFWCGKLFSYDFGGFHSNYAFKFGDTRVNKFDAKDKLKPLELMDLVYISKVQDDEVGVGTTLVVVLAGELLRG